jgi:GTP-binding protein
MAFLDHVKLNIKAGKGGDGVVRWRTARAEDMGGPAGGDGGKGGNVYVVGQRNLHTLHHYAQAKDFFAEDGANGGGDKKHGKSGEDLYLKFPLGSTLYVEEYDRTIDLLEEGQTELLFNGGFGGMGNTQFKSSTNRSPEEFTPGKIGEFGTVTVNLKFIADVGFIGFPNAGKSSLLNALTNAQSKVGNYNFTTLEPHLGDFYGHILADIPGLIEGASDGKGLGIKFLKHVERTGLLVHLIDSKEKDFVKAYNTIRKELGKYNLELLSKKEIVMVTKIDNIFPNVKELSKGKVSLKKFVKPKETKVKVLKLSAKDLKKYSKSEVKEMKDKNKLDIKFTKELYKEELAKWEQLVKEQKATAEKVKLFNLNLKKLEKTTKQRVLVLSLYDDKSLKDFEITLKKALK